MSLPPTRPDEISKRMVAFPSGRGKLRAFLARPKGRGPFPGLLVIQEWWGLNPHIMDVASRFAKQGYVALAPDLYSRQGNAVTKDPGVAARLMEKLTQRDALADLGAALRFLQEQPLADRRRIGTVGFCMGGTYALLLPCVRKGIRAAVPFYGQVPDPDTPLRHLTCPVLYIYGTRDVWITAADVDRLRRALDRYGKVGEVITYEAPHAFFNNSRRDTYRSEHAKDAWNRTLAFLAQHLSA
jgi:carboxymethylenebutenolidase